MKKSFITTYQAVCVAALALATLPVPARAQAVSEARVKELLAQAQAQVQQQAAQAAQAPAPAANSINLTMDQAVAKAIDQNISLTVERLNPQIQDLALAQLFSAYRPTVTSTLGNNWNRQQGTSQLSGGQNVETGVYTFNGGLQQTLPWTGGTAAVTFNNTRTNSNSNNATLNPYFRSGLTASLTQPLLRNFRIDNTRQQIETSRITRDNADINLRATTINTVANTRNAYWDLVYATQAVDAARQSLALAQKLVEDNKSRVEIGTMAPIDVVSAQSEAASRQLALVQATANRQTAEIALKQLLVSGTSDPLWNATLNPTDRPPAVAGENINLEAAIRDALDKRTDLQQARNNLKSSDVSMRYLHNQLLPDMNLNASYGSNGTGGTILERSRELGGAIINTVPGGYKDALAYLRKLDFPAWNVSVNISYPLGTSSADASYARAKVQYEQSKAQLRAAELRVATDVTNAVLSVNNNLQQVQASGASRELAQKKLEAAQSKFEVGMATNYEVVQAQRDLADAQNAELRAILNYRKSLVDFQRLQETSSSGGSGGVSTVSGSVGGGSTAGTGSSATSTASGSTRTGG